MMLKYQITCLSLLASLTTCAWFLDKITTKIINHTPFDLNIDVIYQGDCPPHNNQHIKAGKSKTIETNMCLLKELFIRHNTKQYEWNTTCKAKKLKNQTFTITHNNGELQVDGCAAIERKNITWIKLQCLISRNDLNFFPMWSY